VAISNQHVCPYVISYVSAYYLTDLQIFASRPLYAHMRTTPLAGKRFSAHLRSLLLLFGTWIAPPPTLSGPAVASVSSQAIQVPEEVLTDSVLEEIKTRCCFVGESLDSDESMTDDAMSMEFVPSDIQPSDASSRLSGEFVERPPSSSPRPSSPHSTSFSDSPRPPVQLPRPRGQLQALAHMYMRHSSATELVLRIPPPPHQNPGTGLGALIIPGWIRERAGEILFEGGDVDESSVAEVVLETLLKVGVLRRLAEHQLTQARRPLSICAGRWRRA